MDDKLLSSSDSRDDSLDEDKFKIQQKHMRLLTQNEEAYLDKINELNLRGYKLIQSGRHKEALVQLQQCEKMLEFAATCGKKIDRNLIMVVLFNQACAYQSNWALEKCYQYLDGAIYNMEQILNEDLAELAIIQRNEDTQKVATVLVQRQTFLSKCYLQECAILSQLGKHQQALEIAHKAVLTLQDVFKRCHEYVLEIKAQHHQNNTYSTSNQSQNISVINTSDTYSDGQKLDQQKNDGITKSASPVFLKKNEVTFSKVVLEQASELLSDMVGIKVDDVEQNILQKAQKQIYYWRNNPENNEKLMRVELNAPTSPKDNDLRSILGVQNQFEWMQSFNIGTIMHMHPITYRELCIYSEMICELHRKLLLEKVIYMSIAFFTIATELRFLHLDEEGTDQISEFYHLKAIEMACKHIACSTPYINHLITSYHKHYKQRLDTIPEEAPSQPSESILLQDGTHQKPSKKLFQMIGAKPNVTTSQPPQLESPKSFSDVQCSNQVLLAQLMSKQKLSKSSMQKSHRLQLSNRSDQGEQKTDSKISQLVAQQTQKITILTNKIQNRVKPALKQSNRFIDSDEQQRKSSFNSSNSNEHRIRNLLKIDVNAVKKDVSPGHVRSTNSMTTRQPSAGSRNLRQVVNYKPFEPKTDRGHYGSLKPQSSQFSKNY